jgi:uncharacterized BrkB/YihY/UPF0761 family membrane protein
MEEGVTTPVTAQRDPDDPGDPDVATEQSEDLDTSASVPSPAEDVDDHAAPGRLDVLKERVVARLEPYERVPPIGLGVAAYKSDMRTGGSMIGSAIAFRLFLFFVPLLLLVVGLAGVVGTYVDTSSITSDAGITGGLAEQMSAALNQSGRAPWGVVVLGAFGIGWSGRSLNRVLDAASCAAWGLPIGTKSSWKVIGLIAGLVSAMGLVAVLVNKVRVELGLGIAGISLGAALALYVVAWLIISRALPSGTDDPGAGLPGSVLVAVVLVSMHAISQFYLPEKFDKASQLYGAIGATIVTLGWFFFMGRAIALSLIVNSVIYQRYGSISDFVFGLPVLRSLARRSAFIRRFFDLDHDEVDAVDGDAAGADEDAKKSSA